jgi:hypothetical protein
MSCSKRSFKTRRDATAAIKEGKQKFKRNESTLYKCPYCDSFHLTTCDAKLRESARIASKAI